EGYHDAYDLSAVTGVPGANTFIETAVFPRNSITPQRDHTSAVVAHEVAEWLMDPLTSTFAPMWVDPGHGYCWNYALEVADPLETPPWMQVSLNGLSYDLPDAAFLPWFARISSKFSVNGWYSMGNELSSYSGKCPSFFDGYVNFYFPNDTQNGMTA